MSEPDSSPAPSPTAGDRPGGPHLLDHVRVLHKRRWIAISVFLIVFVSAAINTFRTVPVYEATARIVIEHDEPAVASLEELFGTRDGFFRTDFYQTQYRILQSRRLARRTVGLLGLEGSPRFGAQAQETSSFTEAPWARVTGRVTAWISGVLAGPAEPPDPVAPPDDVMAEVEFIDGFRAGLIISPVEESRLVDVTYRSTDPKLAARVANGYAEAYIEEIVEQKFLVSSEAADWLTEQLAEERLQVAASEAALQRYREQNDGLVVENGQNIVVQRLVDLNAAVTRARTARLEREALFNQLDSLDASALESFPLVVSNTYVSSSGRSCRVLSGSRRSWPRRMASVIPR